MQSSKNILNTTNATSILQTSMKSNNNMSINSTTLNNIHPRPSINPLQHQLLQQSVTMATQQQQNISISAQAPQQITKPSTTFQIPPDCMVIKNEQGQLVLVQQNNNNNRNPLLCNNVLPLQQSSASQRNITSLMQNSVIGSLASNTSTMPPSSTRPIFIQNQNLQQQQQQQQLQRVTILPAQQQLNRLIPNQTNNNTTSSHVTIVTTPVTRASNNQPDQQPNDQKEVVENVMKCKNFLSTLLKLASNQPTDTLNRVMKLIQGLIDDVVTPEEFTSQLQKLLKSSPQPYLIPFLKKSLPYLRKFMIKNKNMEIDGIKPPKLLLNNNNVDSPPTNPVATTTTNNLQTIPFNNLKPVMRTGPQANTLNNQQIFQQHQLQQHQLRKTTKVSFANSITSNSTTNTPLNNISSNNNIITTVVSNNNNITTTNNNNNNTTTNNNSNILGSNDNHLVNMVATSSTANPETFKQNLQQQQQSVMAALHTSKNFIAPTIPLPSSLPRLILSSNSTLLTSIHNQSQLNNQPQLINQPQLNNQPQLINQPQLNNHTTSKLATTSNFLYQSSTPINSAPTNNFQLTGNILNNKMTGQLNNTLMQQQQHNKFNKMPSTLLKNTTSSTDLQQGEKRKFDSTRDDNDDINDVAAMGGVNLTEETRNFSNPLLISGQTFGQTRSFNDEIPVWETQLLQTLVNKIAQKKGLTHVHPDCVKVLSHAVKYKLHAILEQLSVIAEHRSEIYKNEKLMETRSEVKRQLKFRQELAKMEDDKAKEVKNIALMKAAKSRTKTDDPDQLKRKELAKKQQQEDMDAKRKEQSDLTALAAIGSKKKLNLSQKLSLMNGHHQNLSSAGNINLFNTSGLSHAGQILSQRSRRANLKDLLHVLQQDSRYNRSSILYKTFFKY